MWFSMPEGCGGISVELQEFSPEFKDEKGVAYFRAPDHFAPKILAIKGFSQVSAPPEGAPDDLPKADPQRDSAIAELTGTVQAQLDEIRNLRTDLGIATAELAALKNERGDMVRELMTCRAKVTELEEQIEDQPAPVADTKKK